MLCFEQLTLAMADGFSYLTYFHRVLLFLLGLQMLGVLCGQVLQFQVDYLYSVAPLTVLFQMFIVALSRKLHCLQYYLEFVLVSAGAN